MMLPRNFILLGSCILVCAGCQGQQVGSREGCDLLYTYEEIDWDADIPEIDARPVRLLDAVSGLPREYTYSSAAVGEHPWLDDVREWTFWLTPHPRRPPVRVQGAGGCPDLFVFPVASTASGGSGRIVLADSGRRDARDWAADEGASDLPWRNQTSVLRTNGDEISVHLHIQPSHGDVAQWPSVVEESMDTVLPVASFPGRRVLVAGFGVSGPTVSNGLGMRVEQPSGSSAQAGLANGWASSP